SHHGDCGVSACDVRVRRNYGLAKIRQTALPACAAQIGPQRTAPRTDTVTTAAISFFPKQFLAGCGVAGNLNRILRGERANIRQNTPTLVVLEPAGERRHFRSLDSI